jgi:DNA-binding transcriptional MerR regulator
MAVSNVPLRPEPEVVESVNQLTIEQLAAAPGMSVRNIRSHQARGLLAPPEVRLRVGYYGPEHVAQLRLIRDLQEEGFNLNGIKRLLDDTHGTAERLRPIASESLLSIFQQRLGTQIEEAFGEITRRLSQRRRKA